MKIKQIEWSESSMTGHGERYTAKLPLGYFARILGARRNWHWQILLRISPEISGHTATLEEAKEACQKAWEGLLMGALEPVGKDRQVGGELFEPAEMVGTALMAGEAEGR